MRLSIISTPEVNGLQTPEQTPSRIGSILQKTAVTLLTVLLMAVFYVAVVMGQPQGSVVQSIDPDMNQPLLAALPAPVVVTDESHLQELTAAFPAPVMYPLYGSALTFRQGVCSDVSFENGLGRIAKLTYAVEGHGEITVTSIYPARALALMGKGDYVISGTAGQTLAGLRSIRMENDTAIRLHAQGTDALYVVTTPKLEPAVLRQLTAALQLMEGQ